MNYVPLHVHSHFSILDGLSKPQDIIDRCKEIGSNACAITDHGSLSGTVEFFKLATKENIKPILGCELYLSKESTKIKTKENRKLSHLVILAKNKAGWSDLLNINYHANNPDCYYYKPRLNLIELGELLHGNNIAFSGHCGSDLANILFNEDVNVYNIDNEEEIKKLLKPDWEKEAKELACLYRDIFGGGNFYIEIQLIDSERLCAARVIANCLRKIATDLNIPCVATPDAHYCKKEDATDQRLLLASSFNTTFNEVNKKIRLGEDFQLGGFFKSNNYYIPSFADIQNLHTEDELKNTLDIADKCEQYDILNRPMIPKFPDCKNSIEYFTELCREGWKKKIVNKVEDEDLDKYVTRVKNELNVLNGANLADYFLIVHDIVNKAKQRGEYIGVGRGSVGGCLVAHLLDITNMDPIKHNLFFERFYNAGRNTKDRVALPDIDIDFEIRKRHLSIEYIENKYGVENTGQIATFGKMKGRAALKEVLRIHSACSFDEMNEITKYIPDESKISDALEEAKNEGDEPSIIKWAIENNHKYLQQWCYIKDDGSLEGPMCKLFEQAIRMEGTIKSQGKHAAGVIIAAQPIKDIAPLIYDKSNDKLMVGLDLKSAEDVGLVKIDILGTAILDKLHTVAENIVL